MRILATSDLHMQMTAFDYVKDRANQGGSLAKLATLIKAARQEAADNHTACLLFDNGDTFQGTPLADLLARQEIHAPHPMIDAMNMLEYDAGGLGNHDFDYGVGHLNTLLRGHKMPVVCSNLLSAELQEVEQHLILERPVTDQYGETDTLRIGVLSSLPDKTALWNRHHLKNRATFTPPLPALRAAAAALRAKGADLVVVLAHMGFAFFDEGPEAQNLVSEVAALKDVDLVIAGHTHLRFPGPDHAGLKGVDNVTGHVHGTPVVQPGPSGSDLGVVDLILRRSKSKPLCHVACTEVSLRPAGGATAEDAEIVALANKTHGETRAHLGQQVTQIQKPMHSFFALCRTGPVPALLAASKHRVVSRAVAGTPYADLPLLSVASAPWTGGFDGPDNFLFLTQGKVERRHISGLNPYANHVWAVKTTGAQLTDWLERAALIFNTLAPDTPDQMLINPHIPGFRYDSIFGLSYKIDPSKPPRFDASGRTNPGQTGRVHDIYWNNSPLQDTQEFLVATTDHRASGGGLYKVFPHEDIIIHGQIQLQQAVMEYLSEPDCNVLRTLQPWSFTGGIDRSAILLTAPEAEDYLDDIADLKPQACGLSDDGFLRVRVTL